MRDKCVREGGCLQLALWRLDWTPRGVSANGWVWMRAPAWRAK